MAESLWLIIEDVDASPEERAFWHDVYLRLLVLTDWIAIA